MAQDGINPASHQPGFEVSLLCEDHPCGCCRRGCSWGRCCHRGCRDQHCWLGCVGVLRMHFCCCHQDCRPGHRGSLFSHMGPLPRHLGLHRSLVTEPRWHGPARVGCLQGSGWLLRGLMRPCCPRAHPRAWWGTWWQRRLHAISLRQCPGRRLQVLWLGLSLSLPHPRHPGSMRPGRCFQEVLWRWRFGGLWL